MFAEVFLASTLQIGPFWQQWDGHKALCPFWSHESVPETQQRAEADTTDVLWPVFTSHRDWWRFCILMHYQEQKEVGYQFQIIPIWFNGRDAKRGGDYWGLFPIWGHHPHFLLMYDWDFCLWPVWMRYRMPRPKEHRWMTSNVVFFPFIHWRDDGSWGVWPICGTAHQRESDHSYAIWPLATWASYREDRDTPGAGRSWMVWPLYASVERERESQTMLLPPFFSWVETRSRLSLKRNVAPSTGSRLRCPWPIVELEDNENRNRVSVFPLYERVKLKDYADGKAESDVTRFGWKLVEIYRDRQGAVEETRVFPFWTKGRRYFRFWPFWSSEAVDERGEVVYSRSLNIIPVHWIDAIDRNWSPYWTLYESRSNPIYTDHSLLWGIIRWRRFND